MQDNIIFEKLEAMYNKDEKSKNFVLHLIRSYMPLDKITKVLVKPDDLKKFKCALTGAKLVSIDELKTNGADTMTTEDYDITKITDGRQLAFTGKDTNTFLCNDGCQGLLNWISAKSLQGDSKITWTVRSIYKKALNNPAETKKTHNNITQIKNRPATSKLGDLDVLQALKARLEKQENK